MNSSLRVQMLGEGAWGRVLNHEFSVSLVGWAERAKPNVGSSLLGNGAFLPDLPTTLFSASRNWQRRSDPRFPAPPQRAILPAPPGHHRAEGEAAPQNRRH